MAELISINPATLEPIGRMPATPPSKVRELVAAARAAQPAWGRLPAGERCSYIVEARDRILENAHEFACTITADCGKPLAEALAQEIIPAAQLMGYIAAEAPRILRGGELPAGPLRFLGRRSRIAFRPCGVCGVIGPFNYPFAIAAGQVASALACGNAVLVKPSSAAPFAGALVAEVFAAAGIPEGVVAHVPGDASTGRSLVESRLDRISFTGSAAAGREVMRIAAAGPTPLILELGGKDPMIVRADADLDLASSGAVWGAFTNCGQACASIERCYAHEWIYDEFVELCVRKALALKVGNGLDPDVEVGPLATAEGLGRVEWQVADAKARGATIHCGGERMKDRVGFFYPPTVITGVDQGFPIVRDETFGPVLPIMPYSDDMQAVRLANDSAYGLSASIWTGDRRKARAMAREIAAGTVMINDCLSAHAMPWAPWGGVKGSGFGRSHGRHGILEFAEPVHIHEGGSGKKNFWWYGYDLDLVEEIEGLALRWRGGISGLARAIPSLLRLSRREMP
jgi:acyl-CoA reductase-like NAD-dependent aldehyde dehydrogenase